MIPHRRIRMIALFIPLLIGASCIRAPQTDTPQGFNEDIAALSVEDLQSRSDIPSIASSSDITLGDAWEYGESIDAPMFVTMQEARKKLREDVLGILIDTGSTKRYYPFQLMDRHAVVNDVIDGTPVMITYCTRCRTGIVFQRTVQNRVFTFGVSGKLYQNNLLMYNKDGGPQSLWSQAQGKAVFGALSGAELTIFPSQHLKWGEVLQSYQNGEVEIMANGLNDQTAQTVEDDGTLCSSKK